MKKSAIAVVFVLVEKVGVQKFSWPHHLSNPFHQVWPLYVWLFFGSSLLRSLSVFDLNRMSICHYLSASEASHSLGCSMINHAIYMAMSICAYVSNMHAHVRMSN